MTAWFFTFLLAVVIAIIVRAEIVCGRRSKDFIDNVMPEIDALKKSAIRKYQAKYGRAPTEPLPTVEPPRRGLFRK